MPSHTDKIVSGRNLINQGGAAHGANSINYVPDKIYCMVCKKDHPKANFSKRQLALFKPNKFAPSTSSKFRGSKQPEVTCRRATAAQVTELICPVHGPLGLEHFSKNQRKNPDNAQCLKCVNNNLETVPEQAPPSDDDDRTSSDASDGENFDSRPTVSLKIHEKSTQATIKNTASNASKKSTSQISDAYTNPTSAVVKKALVSNFYKISLDDDDDDDDDDEDENNDADEWETVGDTSGNKKSASAKFQPPRTGQSVASGSTGRYSATAGRDVPSTTNNALMKKSNWPKIDKVHKGKEKKWGEDVEDVVEEEHKVGERTWNQYSRDIREKREGKLAYTAPKPSNDKKYDSDEDGF